MFKYLKLAVAWLFFLLPFFLIITAAIGLIIFFLTSLLQHTTATLIALGVFLFLIVLLNFGDIWTWAEETIHHSRKKDTQ